MSEKPAVFEINLTDANISTFEVQYEVEVDDEKIELLKAACKGGHMFVQASFCVPFVCLIHPKRMLSSRRLYE